MSDAPPPPSPSGWPPPPPPPPEPAVAGAATTPASRRWVLSAAPPLGPGVWARVGLPIVMVLGAFGLAVLVALAAYALIDDGQVAGAIAVSASGAAILAGAMRLRRRLPPHERRQVLARQRSWPEVIGIGFAMGIGIIFASGLVQSIGLALDSDLQRRLEENPVELGTPLASKVLMILSLAVLAPLGEELLFRGLLLRGLARRMNFGPAAVVSSVIFGLVHIDVWLTQNWFRALALIVAGLLLAFTYRRWGYWGAVTAHATLNGLVVIVLLASGT